jgi:photosystem II stability/assembly factor-like uncharacterized protein
MILSAVCLILFSTAVLADEVPGNIVQKAAKTWNNPKAMMLLDVTRAGDRIVAVGEHGVAILSDDGGKTYTQAKTMPADCTLTAVTFADAKNGWAVGHWGVIVATTDGGENWQLQHVDTAVDQPLFSVAFKNANEGWAVGLWSLLLHTQDGGKTWTREYLQAPAGSKKADKNLNKIFLDHSGNIFIAGESGMVLRSKDSGKSWVYLKTGYTGSFWTGIATSNGALYVGGLRGSFYRSKDSGATWKALDLGSKASVTGMIEQAGQLSGVALDGYTFSGGIDATVFVSKQSGNRAAFTALVVNKEGQLVITSKEGVVAK